MATLSPSLPRSKSLFLPGLFATVLLLRLFPAWADATEGLAGPQENSAWFAYTTMRDLRDLWVDPQHVWAISPGGVLRFDRLSRTYTRFTRLDGLAGNQISSLTVDARGHLWFGSEQRGLSRFRPETGRFDPPYREFEGRKIRALVAAGNTLFVGTDRGISAFLIDKEEVKENYRQFGRMPKDTPVNALLVFKGKVWAGTAKGLAWADLSRPNLQDPDSWRTLFDGSFEDLLALDDTLYCASTNGVWRIEVEAERFALDLSGENILDLETFRGKLIALTATGALLQRQADSSWQRDALPAVEGARALARAETDTVLWVATENGLNAIGGPPPPLSRETPANAFYDLELTLDGHLWAASVPKDNVAPHGLYEFDGEGWNTFGSRDGLSSEYVTSVATDAKGLLWAGTWGRGINVRDSTGVWHWLNQTNSPLRGIGSKGSFVAISDIKRDAEGLMWIVNVQIGLVVMEGYPAARSLRYDNQALGLLPGRDASRLAIGPDRLKWIGTPLDGFVLFDDGGTPLEPGDECAQAFSTLVESRLTSNRVNDLLVDQRGQLWVATDNGLNRVRGTYSRSPCTFQIDEWKVYNAANGLPANEIVALAEDTYGRLWVGTGAGLAQISSSGEVAFALTTANSGLIDDQVNSLYFDPHQGDLWIGTANGLSRLRLDRSHQPESQGPVVFPNPFVLGGRGAVLTFARLPLGASLEIFTLDGRQVRRFEGSPGQEAIKWDGQNAAGFLVGSGIYFFVASDQSGNQVRGKFAVVSNP